MPFIIYHQYKSVNAIPSTLNTHTHGGGGGAERVKRILVQILINSPLFAHALSALIARISRGGNLCKNLCAIYIYILITICVLCGGM